MANKNKKIIIYGGAFNPPHLGHMAVVESIARLFPCGEIWVMPSGDRKDKRISVAGNHRVRMLELAVGKLKVFCKTPIKISALELDRPKLTSSFDTKQELERLYPENEFYFAIGSDLLRDIENKWINGREVFDSFNFVAIKNPNIALPSKLPPKLTILEEEVIWTNISSTYVRGLLSKGHSGVPYILREVAEYIKENKLYIPSQP